MTDDDPLFPAPRPTSPMEIVVLLLIIVVFGSGLVLQLAAR